MLKKIKRKNKKAVSVMIGYVLLISAAIFIGVVVYAWLKTYVPKATSECPDTTSIFIKDYLYTGDELQITLKNNGKFNLTGYFIRATNSPEQELATIDLSQKLKSEFGGITLGNSILFNESNENTLGPNSEKTHKFDLTEIGSIYSIEIIPIRYQKEDNKIRLVSCGNAKVREMITEWEACIPDCIGLECGPASNSCGDEDECGTCTEGYSCVDNQSCIDENCVDDGSITCEGIECGTFSDNCGNEIPCGNCIELYGGGYVCNVGTCILEEECTSTCESLGLECGFHEICGVYTDCECDTGFKCVKNSCVEINYLFGGNVDNIWPPDSGLYFDDDALPQESGKYSNDFVAFPEVDDTQCFLISYYSYSEYVYPYSAIVHLLLAYPLEITSGDAYEIWDELTDCCNSLDNCA